MAAFALSSCPETLSFGRSGYNKDGDNEDGQRCFGRSGYNKDGDNDDEKRCFGRSGYNKDGDDEDQGPLEHHMSIYNWLDKYDCTIMGETH
ncbi:hypothetical protein F4859DRAFT_508868 [Xylaria cf. heliscus]|nr:hypothetical protein F4859DRAFT_508868 [Xylaria cf. heliscus]